MSESLDLVAQATFGTQPDASSERHPLRTLVAGVVLAKLGQHAFHRFAGWWRAAPWVPDLVAQPTAKLLDFVGDSALPIVAARLTRGGVSEGLMLVGVLSSLRNMLGWLPMRSESAVLPGGMDVQQRVDLASLVGIAPTEVSYGGGPFAR